MSRFGSEKVDGTDVLIYRRIVQRTNKHGDRRALTYRSYSADYIDVDGKRRILGLGTPSRQSARRKAIELQNRLESGKARPRTVRITIDTLVKEYTDYCATKDLAPTSRAKYRAELNKIKAFCKAKDITHADRAVERDIYSFQAWLEGLCHKQAMPYSPKSIQMSMILWIQLFRWGWRQKLIPSNEFTGVSLPKAKARPQPCPTTAEVEAIIERLESPYAEAVAMLAYSGMRVGELLQLRFGDIYLDRGDLGVFRIQRGGSNGTTKSGRERMIPIHPRIRPIIEQLPRTNDQVIPGIRDRMVLTKLKRAARSAGLDSRIKTHSLRHHFASMCSSAGTPQRVILEWMGHASSGVLEQYIKIHDSDSESAMKSLAS